MYVYDQNGRAVQVTPEVPEAKMGFAASDSGKKPSKMVWIIVAIIIILLLGMAWYLMKKGKGAKMGFAPPQRFGFTFY